MNCVVEIAKRDGREYITPEDVGQALEESTRDKVRVDVLEMLGKEMAEDAGLCAYVAWKGDPESA